MWLWQEKCDKSNGTFSTGSYKYKTNTVNFQINLVKSVRQYCSDDLPA